MDSIQLEQSSYSLENFLAPGASIIEREGIYLSPIICYSESMLANAYFFGHSPWAKKYLKASNHCPYWRSRWLKAIQSWDNKIVVDIGCGPGNVLSSFGGKPAMMVGVDISINALKIAQSIGYMPLLADAGNLPFLSGFADIVTMNATVHHCDDMAKVLAEGARLVRPGGLLVTDLDPQASAWFFKGVGQALNLIRQNLPLHWPIYQLRWRSWAEQYMRIATETHNRKPGDGISPNLYHQVLEPLGFKVEIFPHNHHIGDEALSGDWGKAPWQYRLAQILSGINPSTEEASQSIMCVAKRF
jgi:SAM-dependent methyltransferase